MQVRGPDVRLSRKLFSPLRLQMTVFARRVCVLSGKDSVFFAQREASCRLEGVDVRRVSFLGAQEAFKARHFIRDPIIRMEVFLQIG